MDPQSTLIIKPEEITPELIAKANTFMAYQTNMGLMLGIAREMREIPELPSETIAPGDSHPLIKVEFPENGGVLTYMEGYDYPYKGFPIQASVEKIDMMKKTQRAVASSFYHSFKKRSKLQLAFLIFCPWIFADLVNAFIYTFYRSIDRFKIKPLRYCDAIRELHRAFSTDYHGEKPEEKEKRQMIRDLVCMVLEFDNAYRFRFQDIISELNKENLRKNTAKEISRLLEIMSSRENTQEVKDTWKLVRYFLPWYLRFNRSLRKQIVDILTDLDLSKTALQVDDKHFCDKRVDYKFSFMQ